MYEVFQNVMFTENLYLVDTMTKILYLGSAKPVTVCQKFINIIYTALLKCPWAIHWTYNLYKVIVDESLC